VDTALAGDAHGLLGDRSDRVGARGVGLDGLALARERHLADTEGLQCDPDLAVEAKDAQPALGLLLARAGEGHGRGGDAEDHCGVGCKGESGGAHIDILRSACRAAWRAGR
jgi:hypothetical protein